MVIRESMMLHTISTHFTNGQHYAHHIKNLMFLLFINNKAICDVQMMSQWSPSYKIGVGLAATK